MSLTACSKSQLDSNSLQFRAPS